MLQEERAREEERQRLEEERRALEEERRVREEAERKAIHRKNELDRKRSRLPSEPREGMPSALRALCACPYERTSGSPLLHCSLAGERAYTIAIRLPDGSRLTRRFRMSDTIRVRPPPKTILNLYIYLIFRLRGHRAFTTLWTSTNLLA